MKCFMVELFSSYKARENYTQSISEIVFDEALINPQTGEKYLADEPEKIKELFGSFWSVIRKDRLKLKKRVFAGEVVNLENEQGELLSLFKESKCQKETDCLCLDGNCVQLWNTFFAREEDLRMCEFVNGSRALFVFNGCVFYLAKEGYWFFVSLASREISNKDDLPWVKEYCLTYEQRLKSKQKVKWDYSEELLRSDLLGK
ncbi:1354_t:CDS:2 [Entrophospora sp. SA101]|nr:1354_t:CDS:2 [Entrophospora sp. SA101]